MASASLSGLSSKEAPGLLTHEVSSFWNGVVGGGHGKGDMVGSHTFLPHPASSYTELSAGQCRHLQLHEDVPIWARGLQKAS